MATRTFNKLSPEKKERIISSAARLFAENGFTGTSMDAVAEAAGIAKGALYRYFDGKKDLFMLVVDSIVEDFENFAVAFLEQTKDQNVFDSMRDYLAAVYELHERFSIHNGVLYNISFQEKLEFKGEVLAKFGK
ncbi:MAG: TetR/AcrR family transcriptional regulator, partial [Gemmatimonadota bacterium]|nr:TetR/AcrR family transcriptional regulator [Gemmatimonadota bacterium]